jgi:hypothetical protein
MTSEQAKQLQYRTEVHYGECKTFVGPRGGETYKIECWRVNGAVKLWKRSPERFSIPIKYGFNGPYHYIDETNCESFHLASECKPTIIHPEIVKKGPGELVSA